MRIGMIYCGDVSEQRRHLQFSADVEIMIGNGEAMETLKTQVDMVLIVWDGATVDMFSVRSACVACGVPYMVIGR